METQEILLAIFTGILAVAVLMQTVVFFRMYKVFHRTSDRLDAVSKDLLKNVDKVTAKAEETLTTVQEIGNGFIPVKDKMVDAAEIVHQRVVRVDDFLEETTNSARHEVARMKDTVESAVSRTEELMDMLQERILIPVNEIVAITRGLRAGFDFLFRRRRKPSTTVQQSEANEQDDEEMFI